MCVKEGCVSQGRAADNPLVGDASAEDRWSVQPMLLDVVSSVCKQF